MNREKKRQEHMIWTVSGRYDEKPRSILFEDSRLESLDFLRLIAIGGLYRYIPSEYIDDYLLRIVGLGDPTKYYIELLLCMAQEFSFPRLSSSRTQLPLIEKDLCNKIYEEIKAIKPKMERDKLTLAYFTYKAKGEFVKGVDGQIVRTISSMKLVSSADEFMKFLYSIFDLYLGDIPTKYEPKTPFDDAMHDFNTEVLKKSESNIFDDEDLEDAMVLNAEFNHNVFDEELDAQLEMVDETKLFSSHADSKVMFDKILANYGPSKLSDRQRIELEKVLSKDIHKGCKLHYSTTFMSESRGYKRDYIAEQYTYNLRYYEENSMVFDMNIKRLVQIIREKILTDLEETYFNLDRGIPDRNKLYRFVALNDNKVFLKHVKDTVGSIAITILIDSSGSQLARQKQVASWGYVLAQAFTLCSIPVRVVGFNNLFDYTVIREYRDFNDPIGKNKDIFYFTAEGTNRDGMAIKTLSYITKSKEQEKKLILVLSDGKPNDVRVGINSHIVSGHDTTEYTGMAAIDDTAKVVRRARAEGVDVIGIYTGERDEIYSQKLIYGQEFAYVPELNEMGKIVGKVIERVIKNSK